MADLTDEEIAELRRLMERPKADKPHLEKVSVEALELIVPALDALPRLLKEVERRRREMETMIPVKSYRCSVCNEWVPDIVWKVEEHLRSERHLAFKSDPADVLGPSVDLDK